MWHLPIPARSDLRRPARSLEPYVACPAATIAGLYAAESPGATVPRDCKRRFPARLAPASLEIEEGACVASARCVISAPARSLFPGGRVRWIYRPGPMVDGLCGADIAFLHGGRGSRGERRGAVRGRLLRLRVGYCGLRDAARPFHVSYALSRASEGYPDAGSGSMSRSAFSAC